MNVVLWIAQGVLAVMFALAGVMKAFQPKDKLAGRLPWVEDFSQPTVRPMAEGLAELGRMPSSPADRTAAYDAGGMVSVAGPDEITDRILHLHSLLGHSRQILRMDVGACPSATSSTASNSSAPRCSPGFAPS
jgi:hypothetical protein